jgi:hypothetical protein
MRGTARRQHAATSDMGKAIFNYLPQSHAAIVFFYRVWRDATARNAGMQHETIFPVLTFSLRARKKQMADK